MRRELTSKLGTVSLATLLLAVPQLAAAQEADVTPLNADIGFIFTTFMFLVSGFLVFFMAAGFAMLEAGLVRGKNVAMQLTKNMALFSLASLFFYILGYNLMYPGDGWTIQNVVGAFSATALEPVGLEGVEADGFKDVLRDLWKKGSYLNENVKEWSSYSDISAKEARILISILSK